MGIHSFQALRIVKNRQGKYTPKIEEHTIDNLPKGTVLIKVSYSSVNYKDALSAIGNKGITKYYPHTPGIDAAGYVVRSRDSLWKEGDRVIVTGYDLGMNTWGGFSQYIRVPAQWIVRCPDPISLSEAMVWGTAGLTAALSVKTFLDHGVSKQKTVAVSGATGGVGSLSVGLLVHLGYSVACITGKGEEAKRILTRALGAATTLTRDEFTQGQQTKPLMSGVYAGAIDTVGGDILAALLKSLSYGGVLTCCGLVASPNVQINVFPFIIRGVRMIGIDSVQLPVFDRRLLWDKLASEWRFPHLESIVHYCTLAELPAVFEDLLHGKMIGRMVVDVNK